MSKRISRRELIFKTGKALAGAALMASPLHAQFVTVGRKLIDGSAGKGSKALLLPPADSKDPAVHALAENLFWIDIMGEHAALFSLLLPGPELTSQRAQADQFRRTFAAQFDRARAVTLDAANYGALNRSTIELVMPFIEFKRSLLDAQSTGKIHTMMWPAFYQHTIDEADHAVQRLTKLAAGKVTQDSSEVVAFWTGMMSDHADFIAHLLDPKESDLISTALDSAAQFKGFQQHATSKDLRCSDVMTAAEELIDFKTAIETGVGVGTIHSIIPPLFADHVRREALKFVDELKRTGYRT